MIDKSHKHLSARRQAELLCLNRSSLYLKLKGRDDHELANIIAEIYASYPIYGYRRITAIIRNYGIIVNGKRVLRLMGGMNLRAIYPGPNTSKRAYSEMIYPYLVSGLRVIRPNQVWQIDITYLRTNHGFMYLTALIDVYSRVVVGWSLSNSLCSFSVLKALEDAILKYGKPDIINSDQGAQFTSQDWVKALSDFGIKISMTGKGRSNDNAHIERLWRSFKYEGCYLYKWNSNFELKTNIPKWIKWYNDSRPHQALGYMTPNEKYCGFMDKQNAYPQAPQNLQQIQIF